MQSLDMLGLRGKMWLII